MCACISYVGAHSCVRMWGREKERGREGERETQREETWSRGEGAR